MLRPAGASFADVVLGIHIAAVVVGFGVIFAYPIIFTYGMRLDARHMGWFHRVQTRIGKVLISPALLVLVVAGIYLASDLHQWSQFYVQWGIVVALVLGALGPLYFTPREKRLAELADRDVAGAPAGPVLLGPEYQKLNRQVAVVGNLTSLLILITVLLMALRA